MARKQNTEPTELVWSPQPGPQEALFDCPLPEILFGGARGGGKTDGVLGKWGAKALTYGRDFNAILFRKTMPSQDDAWERAHEIYEPVGAKFNETTKSIRFKNGARIRFRPLERVADAEKYQGQNLTDVWIEECGVYADSKPIDRLHGVLRSPRGVPTQMILTGNPGGPGQHWIKERYIDPAPAGMELLKRQISDDFEHESIFIPSRIQDNKILLEGDPGYINRLHLVGSKELVRAWLEGDWNVVEGAYFDNWRAEHVIQPIELPAHWTRFRAMDWGSARPFSVGWYAVASETYEGIPTGALVKYREWYGKAGANVGLKLTAEAVAEGIVSRETSDPKIHYGVLDPAAFAQDGGPSLAERINGILPQAKFRRADNKRVGTLGSMGGWDQLRARLEGEDGKPMLYFFSTCADSIRTIPALQHDGNRPEDVDTDGEDHAADETRYACMSRPYHRPAPKRPRTITQNWTFNDLLQANIDADRKAKEGFV